VDVVAWCQDVAAALTENPQVVLDLLANLLDGAERAAAYHARQIVMRYGENYLVSH